jgi:hypothetical protein
MRPFDELMAYLARIRKRMILSAVLRGAAIAAVCALLATVVLVLLTNAMAFSATSLTWSRALLFLSIAFAVAFGLIAPILAINDRKAARQAEAANPAFDHRLTTCVEAERSPMLDLLARDTVRASAEADPATVIPQARIAGFSGAAAIAVGFLTWLVFFAPGFWGHGAALLWGATPKTGEQPFYEIQVMPGDKVIRRRSDQLITASVVGFQAPAAKLKAKYQGSAKWEETAMLPSKDGFGFEFLLSAVPAEVEYYVEAGNIRSKQYKISVLDLPSVKRIKVTYTYPKWTGLQPSTEDPGGDLRAVAGTQAELLIETDKPLANGLLALDSGEPAQLEKRDGNWLRAVVPIQKDGTYHIAARELQQNIRLTDDYFIEAQQETEPIVKLHRPGRDLRTNPIEEVTLQASAEDDFGLRSLKLHYSVNGGEEKTVSLLNSPGKSEATGTHLLALEDFKLIPGDVVSVYATASDARTTTRTDIYFIEAQPFEREYSQSQSGGGMGGMQGGDEDSQIAQRQKEIIAATWNEIRDKSGDKKKAQEDAKFLSEVQTKLQSQAQSLVQRLRARQITGAAEAFEALTKDLEEATKAMGPAAASLSEMKWQDALPHEQKALQHLLRAEARRREIQVAFGGGGGGGGGQGGRDLESLFELELDTEKNQYETGQQQASAGDRQREIDEALQKLEQLARRQQELAQRQQNNRQTPEQRWQQEMLRRETEELQKQMQQLAQGQQSQSQSQQGQQGQSGQQGQQSQQGGQSQGQSATQQRLSQMAAGSRGGQSSPQRGDPRVQRALEQLTRAQEDMRRANQPGQTNDAEARRAAERLKDAQQMMGGMRQEQTSGQIGDLARRAEKLAEDQRNFSEDLKRRFGAAQTREQQERAAMSQSREDSRRLAQEKTRIKEDYERLERDLQSAARGMAGSQRNASSKLREAVGQAQQEEISLSMKYMTEWLNRGYGPFTWNREQPVTQALDRLAEQVKDAARVAGENPGGSAPGDGKREQALSQIEQMRRRLDQASRGQQPGQQPGNNPGGQQGQQGQQGQGEQGQQGQGRNGQGGQDGQGGERGEGQPSEKGGGGSSRGDRGQLNAGDWRPGMGGSAPERGPVDPAEAQRAYSEGLRGLRELRQQLGEASPEARAEVDRLIQEMQRIDPNRFPGNPALVEKMRSQVLPALEQLELQLRREIDGAETGLARSGGSERIPDGYSEAVAEYFRRLGRAKP